MLLEEFNEIQKLDTAIDKILSAMQGVNPDSDEFAKMADQVTKLIKAKEIIGNLKLKAFEANNKQTNDGNALQVKKDELDVRKAEIGIRETEIAKNTNLRGTELLNRKEEVEVNRELKEAELALRQEELADRRRVGADTWAIVGANVAGIVLILAHERINVIASKALGFVVKLR